MNIENHFLTYSNNAHIYFLWKKKRLSNISHIEKTLRNVPLTKTSAIVGHEVNLIVDWDT